MTASLLILGPTAGGKTTLAVETALALANRGGAEIVTADSMQVYRGLDIGTAKPDAAEQRGVPHHLVDVCDPGESFSVDAWLGLAEEAIEDIRSRGALPIVAGGTHLYIKAFLDGLFEGPPADELLRKRLQEKSRASLRSELETVDPEAAARIHPNDIRRTIRALEVHALTGTPISALQRQWEEHAPRRDVQIIALQWPTPELNNRINARVRAMMETGLLEETQTLWAAGNLGDQAREALGYKQLIAHLEGRCDLDEAAEQIKIETRRYAKNQRTWLRRILAEQTRRSNGANDGSASGSARAPVIFDATDSTPESRIQTTVNIALSLLDAD